MNVSIQTAQNVSLQYETASIGDRMVALLIDYIIFLGWFLLTALLPSRLGFLLSNYYYIFVVTAPIAFYDLVCEWVLNGQSVGKIAMKIRVVMLDGSQPTLGAYLLRWVLRLLEVSALPAVGLITMALSHRGQRLGDVAAGTTVVIVRQKLTFNDLNYSYIDDNQPVQLPEVAQLTDLDMATIRDVLALNSTMLIVKTADQLRQTLDLQTALPARELLQQVIHDHQQLATPVQ